MPSVGDGSDGGSLSVGAAGRCCHTCPAACLGGGATAVWVSPPGAAAGAGGRYAEPQEAAPALCRGAACKCVVVAGASGPWARARRSRFRMARTSGGRWISYRTACRTVGGSEMLCVVDDCTRECLGLVADTSLSGLRVARELDAIVAVARAVANGGERKRDGADAHGHPAVVAGAWRGLALHRARASRSRTRMSRASTGGCGTNA